MVMCLRSLQWSGGEVSLVGQGEKSVGGAENLTWNPKNLPSKLNFFTNEVVFYIPEPDQNVLSKFFFKVLYLHRSHFLQPQGRANILLAVGPATHRKPGQPGIHRPDGDVHQVVQGKVQEEQEEEQPSLTRWTCSTLCPG